MTAPAVERHTVTDTALRSVRSTIAERLLDRADLAPDELRARLTGIGLRAGWEQPGAQVEHVIEAHALWLEAEREADSLDGEDRASRAHWRLDQAIRELVAPAVTR